MDSVSFQNGFVCGIATKGLVKSGAFYEPEAYNDAGVYDFFYLDFKRVMEPFSIGQFNESVIVSGTSALSVSQVTQATDGSGNKIAGVYKVYCDISAQTRGVSISHHKNSRLNFWDGTQVPVFSTFMYVAGLATYIDGGYAYDSTNFVSKLLNPEEWHSVDTATAITTIGHAESATFSALLFGVADNASVSLI